MNAISIHVRAEALEELEEFYTDLDKQFSGLDCMINQFERIFIDLGYRHLKNMMGVIELLEVHLTNLSIKIPLAAIFRSLTAAVFLFCSIFFRQTAVIFKPFHFEAF